MVNEDNQHYRYCFQCDKWLTKEEVNVVDWGPQPGGEMGKCWHCSHCRKQVGDDSQTQIFRCEKHSEEILKVWGTCEGENQEKVFYKTCPQEQPASFWEKIPLPAKIGGGIITLLLGLLITLKLWFNKKTIQVKDKLKAVKNKFSKEVEPAEKVNKDEEDEEIEPASEEEFKPKRPNKKQYE